MRRACLLGLVAIAICAPATAMAAAQESAAQSLSDLERNMALGAVLDMREGTQAELGELRLLADRGITQAQAAVAADPGSADAQYALGSWLLYGYRVVEVDQITFDAQGNAETTRVTRVVQGSDDPEEGLAALNKASQLAPDNVQYLLDHAAALMDYDRADQAEGMLKSAWVGQPELPLAQKIHAAVLLSGIAEMNGDLDGAREWVYSALLLDPIIAPVVGRLRELDDAVLEAILAPPAEADEGQWEGSETIEGAPSAPEEGGEEYYGGEEGEEFPEEWYSGEEEYQEPSDEYYEEDWYQEDVPQDWPGEGGLEQEEAQPETGY